MFKVRFEPCDQCLFSKDRVVDQDRAQQVLRQCVSRDQHFICHKATIEGQEVCCREFYDRMGHRINMCRISERMGWVEFTDDKGNPAPISTSVGGEQ